MSDSSIHVSFELFYEHVRRAAAAYDERHEIMEMFGGAARVYVDIAEEVDLLTFVEIDDEARVQWVVIRGTDNLENIKSDLGFVEKDDTAAGVRLHCGFQKVSVASYDFARALLHPEYETRVTGHSLGGAVAAILMMRLHNDGLILGSCITFGQPKVTDEEGVERYRALPLWRVINEDDMIPMVPPNYPYCHFGREVHLTRKGKYRVFNEHQSERSPDGHFWSNIGRMALGDHHIYQYVNKVARHASKRMKD
jgi:hypothetical protein